MAEETYLHDEDGRSFSEEDFRNVEREKQKSIMRNWFLSNYENPVENTPYESQEGGYIYVWGGPYYASEELTDRFGELVAVAVIKEVVDELEEQTIVWTGKAK